MRRRLNEHDETDPMAGMGNLFDVAMVFAVALMVALVSRYNMTMIFDSKDFTVVQNPGTKDMEIVKRKDGKIIRLKADGKSDQKTMGKDQMKKVGTAFQLENGEVIYLPEVTNE